MKRFSYIDKQTTVFVKQHIIELQQRRKTNF